MQSRPMGDPRDNTYMGRPVGHPIRWPLGIPWNAHRSSHGMSHGMPHGIAMEYPNCRLMYPMEPPIWHTLTHGVTYWASYVTSHGIIDEMPIIGTRHAIAMTAHGTTNGLWNPRGYPWIHWTSRGTWDAPWDSQSPWDTFDMLWDIPWVATWEQNIPTYRRRSRRNIKKCASIARDWWTEMRGTKIRVK